MTISIHRGINQIGGCITEIATANTRILIDLGQNLPDGDGNVVDKFANSNAINQLTQNVDAIFYTHYHGDHIGLFHLVPEKNPQYIGEVAKRVVFCKHKKLSYKKELKESAEKELAIIDKMIPYKARQIITIGDIKITPYFVSHSAYDAFMFLIEADGKRIIHTGDFRDHGYLGKGLIPTIQYYILKKGKIDFLITEGTMLSRLNEKVRHENQLKLETIEILKQYKNVFVLCSSTDLEKLATFHAANVEMKGRPFVCDSFQKDVLQIFTDTAGKESPLFNFGNPYSFRKGNTKLMNWIQNSGVFMLVRATETFHKYIDFLMKQMDQKDTILIYSMWQGYITKDTKHTNQKLLDFIQKFENTKSIHTSGHASAECLAEVCNLINPTMGIIPIHSEISSRFHDLPIKEELKAKIITKSTQIDDVTITIGLRTNDQRQRSADCRPPSFNP